MCASIWKCVAGAFKAIGDSFSNCFGAAVKYFFGHTRRLDVGQPDEPKSNLNHEIPKIAFTVKDDLLIMN